MTVSPITAPLRSDADLADEYAAAARNLNAQGRAYHALSAMCTPDRAQFSTFAEPTKNFLARMYEEMGVWFTTQAETAQEISDSYAARVPR